MSAMSHPIMSELLGLAETNRIAFESAKAAYLAAKAAESAYDNAHYYPAINAAKAQGECAVFDDRLTYRSDQLADARSAAEDALMAVPAPDGAAFAFKYLVAHGDGRETDCWDGLLEQEARLMSSATAAVDPHVPWLAERDALLTRYNLHGTGNDDVDQMVYDAARAVEKLILSTPAATKDGVLVKALLNIGGRWRPEADEEAAILDEAKALGLMEWPA